MPIPTLSDVQDSWLSAFGGAAVGFLSNFLIEWYKKRSKKEIESEVTDQISEAADKNIVTTQRVIEILDERLLKDREYYDELIKRSKEECQTQIEKMKIDYDEQIEELQAKIIKGTAENVELTKQIEGLTRDKDTLQLEVVDLKERLSRYENGLNPAI